MARLSAGLGHTVRTENLLAGTIFCCTHAQIPIQGSSIGAETGIVRQGAVCLWYCGFKTSLLYISCELKWLLGRLVDAKCPNTYRASGQLKKCACKALSIDGGNQQTRENTYHGLHTASLYRKHLVFRAYDPVETKLSWPGTQTTRGSNKTGGSFRAYLW